MNGRSNSPCDAIRRGGSARIPFEELIEVSEATIAIEEAVASGKLVSLPGTRVPVIQETAQNL